jgi:lysophospholipase L1-like esterase
MTRFALLCAAVIAFLAVGVSVAGAVRGANRPRLGYPGSGTGKRPRPSEVPGGTMKRALSLATLTAVVALSSAAHASADNGVHYYVALCDSLSVGVQPTNSYFDETNAGYADQLWRIERAKDGNLVLVKLGCAGESTTSMIEGSPYGVHYPAPRGDALCQYRHGSQLAEAVAFLEQHRGQLAFVTIDVGANDIFGGASLQTIQTNLTQILSALHQAAGAGVPIVGMNYYNPFSVEWFSKPDSLQGHVDWIVGFNEFLEAIYAAAGDPVADVENAFSTTDTTPVGGIPLDVLRVCQWTWMCAAGDYHPNATGYDVIASAFADALEP